MEHWQVSKQIAWEEKGRNTSILEFLKRLGRRESCGSIFSGSTKWDSGVIWETHLWAGNFREGVTEGTMHHPSTPKWLASSSRSQDTQRSERKGPARLHSLMLSVPTLLHHPCYLCHCCCHCHHHHPPLTPELTFFDIPLTTEDLWFSKNPKIFNTRLGLLRYATWQTEQLLSS